MWEVSVVPDTKNWSMWENWLMWDVPDTKNWLMQEVSVVPDTKNWLVWDVPDTKNSGKCGESALYQTLRTD